MCIYVYRKEKKEEKKRRRDFASKIKPSMVAMTSLEWSTLNTPSDAPTSTSSLLRIVCSVITGSLITPACLNLAMCVRLICFDLYIYIRIHEKKNNTKQQHGRMDNLLSNLKLKKIERK
jgi:hypothetical protein